MKHIVLIIFIVIAFSVSSFSADKTSPTKKGTAKSTTATKTKKQKETASSKTIKATSLPECQKRCENISQNCIKKSGKTEQNKCEYYRDQCKDRCIRQYSR